MAITHSTFYMLLCRLCGGHPIPFGSADERGAWAAKHTESTGHEDWWVGDVRLGTPPENHGAPPHQAQVRTICACGQVVEEQEEEFHFACFPGMP